MELLVFDFDGFILDTESPDYQSWVELFAQHGCVLPIEDWADCIGRKMHAFDVYAYLSEKLGYSVDRDAIRQVRRARFYELLAEEKSRPGVCEYMEDAKRLGLKLGVASSADRDWVTNHLKRLNLIDYFDCIRTVEDVEHAKPAPDLFLAVTTALDIAPNRTIGFEDSPNGITAAKRAGLWCVAVPNPVTQHLDLSHADLQLPSLADMPLEALIERLTGMETH